MKKPIRMIVFSLVALVLTAWWDRGFILQMKAIPLIELAFFIAILHYIVKPISKIILLPLNLVTLGLASLVLYFILFYVLVHRTSIVTITDWVFPGFHISTLTVQKIAISKIQNIALSSLSVSVIIRMLEKLL